MILCTSFTQDYGYGRRYVDSLERWCNIEFCVLGIDWTPEGKSGRKVSPCGMPREIMQAGHFLESVTTGSKCRVIFTDADILMHRSLEDDELEMIDGTTENQIAACSNQHPKQTVAEEVPLLWKTSHYHKAEMAKWVEVPVFNTGFVWMWRSTYEALFKEFKKLWPLFDRFFDHYAKIQLCMCVAAHELGLEWMPIQSHLCSHGHFGPHKGVDFRSNPPTHHGRVIAFDHKVSFQ